MTTKTTPADVAAQLELIAKRHFNVATLQTRNSDSLDFYDVSVWGIREALEEAYAAGQNAGHETIVLTKDLIDKAAASDGYHSDEQLDVLGVSLPRTPNWKQHLIGKEVLKRDYDLFCKLEPIPF